jgi:predicted DNA-binding transcriptional regulator AlpA
MVSKTTATPTKTPTIQQGETIQVLTVQQVADRLKIPPSSIYEKTRFRGARGVSPLPCRKVGRYLRFIAAEVDAWFLALPPMVNRTKRRYRRKTGGAA